jgi:hypothetical protein
MTLMSVRSLVLVLGFVVAAAGCRKKTPPVTPLALKPAAEARQLLVAEFVFPSLQRSSASAGQVAQRLGLPFSALDMLKTLGGQAGLPPAAVDRIDLAQPTAVAAVLTGAAVAGKGSTSPVAAFALKDSSPAGFDAFVAAAGNVGQRVQDAVRLQRGDAGGPSSVWLLGRQGAVCVSERQDLLQAGCGLAFAARKSYPEDLRATVVPDGLAKANGTTVDKVLADARKSLAEQRAAALARAQSHSQTGPGKPDPRLQAAADKMADAMTGYFLDAGRDLAELRLLLSLDESKGLGSTIEAVPRPSSELGRRLAMQQAYTVDPALLAGPPPGSVFAFGSLRPYADVMRMMQQLMMDTAANDKERETLKQSLDTVITALAGPMSGRFDLNPADKPQGRLSYRYDLSYTLAPGTDGKALLDAYEKLAAGPWMKRLFDQSGSGMKLKLSASRQKGKPADTVVLRMSLDPRSLPPELKGKATGLPFLDGKPMEAWATVVGDRLVMSMSDDAKAGLQALLAAAPGAPTGDVALAMSETQGDDSFFYADLATILRPAMAMAVGQAAASGAPPPVIAQIEEIARSLRLGMWGSHRGGSTLTLRWRLPMTSIESAGTAVRAFMGMRGASQTQ